MRLADNDGMARAAMLLIGVTVVVDQPLRLAERLWGLDSGSGIDPIPALAVLAGGLAVYHLKRLQTRQTAAAAQLDVTRTRQRTAELERLAAFCTALGAAADDAGVSAAFRRFMPAFSRGRDVWMITRREDTWNAPVHGITTGPRRDAAEIEAIAATAVAQPTSRESRTSPPVHDDDVCLPMIVGGRVLGVVGVRRGPPDASGDEAMSAAVALLAAAARNLQLLAETREHSVRDCLTGCFNRAYAIEALSSELHRARRSGRPLSIMMFDLDRFKESNDQFGHLTGDAILAAVAAQCGRTLRASDIKCRWGGDEFLIVLPDTPLAGAERAGESLTRDVASLRIPTGAGAETSPTISIGVAEADQADGDPLALIARADQALYQAKRAGRNRLAVAASMRKAS